MHISASRHSQQGFTIVEVAVTTVLIALFMGLFFQTYVTLEQQRINVARQAKASDIAQANLRKVANRPDSLLCTSDMDLTNNTPINASLKKGQPILLPSDYDIEPVPAAVIEPLGPGATQQVYALAPSGCSAFATSPIKIVSIVTYGSAPEEVIHVGYIR